MENELKELKETLEKMIKHSHLHFQIVENEFKMLRYEMQNNIIQHTTTLYNINDYICEIKCRMCGESKKVPKNSNNVKCNICNECCNALMDGYDSDNDIC